MDGYNLIHFEISTLPSLTVRAQCLQNAKMTHPSNLSFISTVSQILQEKHCAMGENKGPASLMDA